MRKHHLQLFKEKQKGKGAGIWISIVVIVVIDLLIGFLIVFPHAQ